MKTKLSNDLLTVTIDSIGAEVHSVINNRTQTDYIWCGDKRFWGRHSPVLFPLVGKVWEGKYLMDGTEFQLGQHGFARNNEFAEMPADSEDEVWFALESSGDTLMVYPRHFRLEIGYRLQEARLTVMWRVRNADSRTMHFHIGAHPAFNYPAFDPEDSLHGYLAFDSDSLESELLDEYGCVVDGHEKLHLDQDDLLPLIPTTFERLKTIILADSQVRRVSMLDAHKRPYVSVLFDAPVVGIWSPSPDAPFVCIEPWWGHPDHEGYKGEFVDRPFTNTIEPGQTFEASYTIIFDNF